MRKALQTLSGKLTLCSIAMMLVMWLAVGAVLVWSTANEIMEGSMDLARAQAQEYSHDSYLQTYYTSEALGFDQQWLENSCEMGIDFLFPRTNREAHARYLQYNLFTKFTVSPENAFYTPLPPQTLVGIQAIDPASGAEEGTFLSLEQFSPSQLSEISRGMGSVDPDHLPALTAVGTREGLLFQVEELTLDGKTYSAANLPQGAAGTDTITLKGVPEVRYSYYLFPTFARTVQEWEMFLSARDYALEFGSHKTENTIFQHYSSSSTALYLDSETSEVLGISSPEELDEALVYLRVVIMSTPLKTALEENGPVLLRLLVLAPVLGLLFAFVIRRMVVLPLQRTQEDFQKVARLDFTGLSGDAKRKDEIGELNRSLRKMSGELQRRWDDERALEQRRREFVSAASHELKTPLALMRGYTEGLMQNIGDREEYLASMEGEIDRMNALVLEMLEQTRLEGMEGLRERETVDLTALTRELLAHMAPLFDGLTLTAQLAEGVALPGDRKLLERGIGNLLSNAARYCTPGGRVRVELAAGPVLTVENDSDPIPEEELPRLFEMFYRGDKARDRSGSGMGLAIAQKIFALHHMICKAEHIDGGIRFILRKMSGENC